MKDNIFCHIITDIHHESSNNMTHLTQLTHLTHLTHSRANGFTGEREVGRGLNQCIIDGGSLIAHRACGTT